MAKWEYANVRIAFSGPLTGIKTELTLYHSNKKHETTEREFGDLMAWMGDNEWELIISNARIEGGLGSQHIINYMFKRPKQ